jgi:cytochrome oxidase Cu insertion factor (SCO1/SenC/PrrC family)
MTRRDLSGWAGFLVLVFAAAFAGVWAGNAFRDARAPAGGPPAVESDLVPGAAFPAETVLDAAGAPHDLARLASGGAVVMFLAADCGACGMTLEHWQPEIEGGALAGVRVIGVTYDPAERLAEYPAKGARFPVYRDAERVFGLEHGVTGVPTVVVVAPGGEIRDRWVGHRDEVDFDRIRDLTSG